MSERVLLYVGNDLVARSRLEQAARTTGTSVQSAGCSDLKDHPATSLVVVDLDACVDSLPDSLPSARVVGYYSHVDDRIRARAEQAGIEAYPRSRFWRELEGLLDQTPDADV